MLETEADRQVTARLINWGVWNKGGFPHLGTPAYVEIMRDYFPQRQLKITPNNLDAEHIEYVISTIELASRHGIIEGAVGIYPLVLKLEYIEYERPRELKAEHIRRRHDVKCSERTFRYHLSRAKQAVHLLANPLVLPVKHDMLVSLHN